MTDSVTSGKGEMIFYEIWTINYVRTLCTNDVINFSKLVIVAGALIWETEAFNAPYKNCRASRY